MSKDARGTPSIDPEKKAHEHDEDVVHVPKGTNRARFLLTTILVFMVLGTFTVSREVVDVLTGQGKTKNAYMSWKRPDGTVETMKQMDFMLVRQNIARVESIFSGGKNSKEKSDAQIARHIILDELAKAAGVDIADSEIRDLLKSAGWNSDIYRQTLSHYRTTTTEFEETLRSLLRVARYEQLLGAASAVPDPKVVLDHWKTSHKEYQLDAIELPTAGFADEAAAACPKGDELKAWFDALPDPEKNAYRQPIEAKTAAEFAWFGLDPLTKTDPILHRYPRPSTENADDVAKTWYEANKDLLYRKPEVPAGKAKTPEDYVPFDSVKDAAKSAGLAYQSILDWVNDMRGREEKGEKVEFSPEAIGLGLAYRREETAHTRAEWKAASMAWSGQAVLAATFSPTAQVGKVLDAVVDPKGIFVGRLLEKQDSRMPAFEEFQDKVRDAWIAKKKGELALAKLEALRAKFPAAPETSDAASKEAGPKDPANLPVVEPDGDKFKLAAKELGIEVRTEDWIDPGAPIRGGVMPSPFTFYERQSAQSVGATIGAIAKPSLAGDKTAAWMVRIAGSRDPDPSKITPQDYQTARQLAIFQSRSELFDKTFGSDEYLKQRYGLELEAWRRKDGGPASKSEPSAPSEPAEE
jgi:hypothetical protein